MKIKILLIVLLAYATVGCEKYLDINTDPNNPSDVSISQLLPYVQLSATRSLSAGAYGIGQDLGVYTHQLSTREEPDKYKADGNEYYIEQSWSYFYVYTYQNLEILIDKSEEQDCKVYAGIGKILKAYMFSQFVDIYGDVPFSEAANFKKGISYPSYDDGEDIYPALLALLDEGIADLNNAESENALLPGSNDLMYGGKKASWIKAANTIKLKLYNQLRLVQDVSDEVQALVNQGNLISTTADGMMFYFTSKRTPDERNPAYTDIYEATQKSMHISPWFYEILKGYNPRILTGLVDPRIPYYFYNQLSPTMADREGNATEYRDGGFVSIYFGSDGNDRDHSQDKSLTVYGIYPCGGRYDAGDATVVNATSGTGAAPYRFLTYADKLFIEAELIREGVLSGDAKAKLAEAIDESFKLVDYVVTKTGTTQTVPKLVGSASVTDYKAGVLQQFDAATAAKQLEIIMTQKWISSFGSYVDQYTDIRRTGYPVVFDPNNAEHAPGGKVTPPEGGDPARETAQPVPVSRSLNYPRTLPWPNAELNVNKNAPVQKTDPSTYKVFWDTRN